MFMSELLPVSLLALVAGTVAHMGIGMAWFSPMLFGDHWLALTKIKRGSLKMDERHIIGSALIGATLTLVLGYLLSALGATTCLEAIKFALILWIGFVATTHFSPVLWEKRPLALYALCSAYWAVDLLVISCIVTKW